jgi:glyoxylase-like metal-dependent hydrolase (beta-lactamase superfamily II)
MDMHVETLVVSPYQENTYIVWDADTMRGFVLDPGDEGARIIARVEALSVKVEAILLTHGHSDHIGAVADVKAKYDVPIYIGTGEEEMLTDPNKNLSAAFGLSVTAPAADHLLNEGDSLNIAGFDFKILSAPGHSPASICYLHERVCFDGDVVFMGSIGRTDLPGSNHELFMQSISEKILPLPDDVFLYPGHGPATTVGHERATNPFLLALSRV